MIELPVDEAGGGGGGGKDAGLDEFTPVKINFRGRHLAVGNGFAHVNNSTGKVTRSGRGARLIEMNKRPVILRSTGGEAAEVFLGGGVEGAAGLDVLELCAGQAELAELGAADAVVEPGFIAEDALVKADGGVVGFFLTQVEEGAEMVGGFG